MQWQQTLLEAQELVAQLVAGERSADILRFAAAFEKVQLEEKAAHDATRTELEEERAKVVSEEGLLAPQGSEGAWAEAEPPTQAIRFLRQRPEF